MQITKIADRTPNAAWPHYEKLLAAIDTRGFGTNVREALLASTGGARRLYLFEATRSDDSDLQYSFCEPGVRELFPIYSSLYLPLDPVNDAYRAAPRNADIVLQRVRPEDIPSASFRRRIFDEPGIVERVSVVQRGADSWRVMSVARHHSDGCLSDREVEVLVGLARLTLPMLPLNRVRPAARHRLTLAQFEERFAERGAGLTPRERQVCARAAIGMTVEATALDLAIAKTSVPTYRKRAYKRLGITSPFELSALVTH